MTDNPTQAAPFRGLVPCPACDGSGVEVYGVTVYEPGCSHSHDSTDERECGCCRGTGEIWKRCWPVGEEWTL